MPKINRITAKKTFGQILKQKKLEKLKTEQARVQANIAQKEAEFDSFVKQTAKDMLKDFQNPRIEMNVIDYSNLHNRIYDKLFTDSVWASWSKMSNPKRKK